MKIIKNRLFLVIVTAFICVSVTAYASSTYYANQIRYIKSNSEEVTLDSALNELYSSASIESYTPSGHITPTTSEQEFQTAGKKVTSNIIVDPIPSSYKNISASTLTSASELAPNVVAHKSDGTAVTGTGCIRKSITLDATSTSTNGLTGQMMINFRPSIMIFVPNAYISTYTIEVPSGTGNTTFYAIYTNGSGSTGTDNHLWVSQNAVYLYNQPSTKIGNIFEFIVCK